MQREYLFHCKELNFAQDCRLGGDVNNIAAFGDTIAIRYTVKCRNCLTQKTPCCSL